MKKLFISILIVLLIILTYFLIIKNIKLGSWTNKSISNIRDMSNDLDKQINIAEAKVYQEYPTSVETLETAIKTLETTKENYEKKTSSVSQDIELGIVKLKEYKVERLWITIANYAKKENVELKLDLEETVVEDVYNLNVTVIGEYIGITDFIYDIEKDDTLGFKILNFSLGPTVEGGTSDSNQSGNTKTYVYIDRLTATFEIHEVGIDLS